MDDYQSADVKYKHRDFVLKLVGGLFVLIGGVVGLFEYGVSIKKEIAFKEVDIKGEENRSLLNKQFELYFEASRLAASIAAEMNPKTAKDQTQLALDKHNFETLYFGPMVIVEERSGTPVPTATAQSVDQGKYTADGDVERRMIEFHRCVFEKGNTCDPRNLSLALADSCRISLAKRSRERVDELQKTLPLRKWLTTTDTKEAPGTP
jgi:hypothetical protein